MVNPMNHMNQGSTQPIFILANDTKRTSGREAQRENIQAAKLVAETVRTTLGPKGMDKMVVDRAGEVTVTNDGATILRELAIAHPVGKMIVEIANTQEREVGDGTTTAVILAGELLKRAETLLDKEIHPTIIARGYRMATEKAQEILKSLGKRVETEDKKTLIKIATTATTGKGVEVAKEDLAELVVRAALTVVEVVEKENREKGKAYINIGRSVQKGYRKGGQKGKVKGEVQELRVPRDSIKIEKRAGASIEESQLINGILLDKERVHPNMPKSVKKAKILLLDSALEVKSTETDAKISITDPEKLQGFLDMEEQMLQQMVKKIVKSGATVVCCQKGIDDIAQHELAKANIMALRRVMKRDLERLVKATGAIIVSSLDDAKREVLGDAGLVEEIEVGDEPMIIVKECKHPKAVTILVRGGTEQVTAEAERALEDAIGVVNSTLREGAIVAGAGAPEMELSRRLLKYATTLKGREQLAVQAFSTAMESVPQTLAENAGIDPIDALTEMKSAHERGEVWAGIDVFSGKRMDAWKRGVLEPLRIKTQAISSASEVAIMILRIDDVISTEEESRQGIEDPSKTL